MWIKILRLGPQCTLLDQFAFTLGSLAAIFLRGACGAACKAPQAENPRRPDRTAQKGACIVLEDRDVCEDSAGACNAFACFDDTLVLHANWKPTPQRFSKADVQELAHISSFLGA